MANFQGSHDTFVSTHVHVYLYMVAVVAGWLIACDRNIIIVHGIYTARMCVLFIICHVSVCVVYGCGTCTSSSWLATRLPVSGIYIYV